MEKLSIGLDQSEDFHHTKLPEWEFTSSSDRAGVGSGKAWRLSL